VTPTSAFETIVASRQSLRKKLLYQPECRVALILRDREAIVSKDEGGLSSVRTPQETFLRAPSSCFTHPDELKESSFVTLQNVVGEPLQQIDEIVEANIHTFTFHGLQTFYARSSFRMADSKKFVQMKSGVVLRAEYDRQIE
jgi:hypothetical protein